MTPETNKNAVLLAKLDELINESLENSNPIGMTLCAARKRISDQSDRIAELWDAMEILRRERDEARELYKVLEGANNHLIAANEKVAKLARTLKQERDEQHAALLVLAEEFETRIQKANRLAEKAKELVARWDQPSWKDTAPTAGFIYALRDAVEAYEERPE